MKSEKRVEQFSAKILSQIQEMFQEDAVNQINLKELESSDELRDFLHALANVVPTMVYNKFTGSDLNFLEFNHIANTLCVENMVTNKS